MDISAAERKQIENEMIFRRINEKVGTDLEVVDAGHIKDGNLDLVSNKDLQLQFKCECSDENCEARITMPLAVYREIHLDRDTFIVKLNHQVDPIEKVVVEGSQYHIVKKNNSTPEPGDQLNSTTIQNS